MITPHVAELLKLEAVGLKKAYTANGWYETPVYRLDAILPCGVRVTGSRVSTGDLMVCDMLIGMDIINHVDMQLTNSPTTRFKFRLPSQGNVPFGA